MLRKLRNRIKGQSTAEYAILIALVVAAVIAMQTYAKRALMARQRDAALFMVRETNFLGTTQQCEPYYLESSFDVSRSQESTTSITGNTSQGTTASQDITRGAGGFQMYKYNMQGNGI